MLNEVEFCSTNMASTGTKFLSGGMVRFVLLLRGVSHKYTFQGARIKFSSLVGMNMNKDNIPKYLWEQTVCDIYCWVKVIKCFNRIFKIKNSYEQTINKYVAVKTASFQYLFGALF